MERFTFPSRDAALAALNAEYRRGEQYMLIPVENGRWVAIATDGTYYTDAGHHRRPGHCFTCGSCDLDAETGDCLSPLHAWEPKPETGDLFRDMLVLEAEEVLA